MSGEVEEMIVIRCDATGCDKTHTGLPGQPDHSVAHNAKALGWTEARVAYGADCHPDATGVVDYCPAHSVRS